MKSRIQIITAIVATVAGAALFAPLTSSAESGHALTRSQVREELARLEQAGYAPGDWTHYPESIQEAEARVAARRADPTRSGDVTDGQARQ